MIKDDVNLSVAFDILDRKIANLNMEIAKNPQNEKARNERDKVIDIRKKIREGNVELIKKVINSTAI